MKATQRILNELSPEKVEAYPAQSVIATAKRYFGNDQVVALLGKQGFRFVLLACPFWANGRYFEAGSVAMFFEILEQEAKNAPPKPRPKPSPKLLGALPDSINCALLTYQITTTIAYLLI